MATQRAQHVPLRGAFHKIAKSNAARLQRHGSRKITESVAEPCTLTGNMHGYVSLSATMLNLMGLEHRATPMVHRFVTAGDCK